MEQLTAARIRHPKIIERPRLTRQLDACGARVILLIAPAGYGKTTLAREWLRTRPHAWYTATAASVDVAALATGVAHAMQKIVPGVGERMLTRLRLSTLPSAEAEVFADMLAEDLGSWPEGTWLALDDYQAISGSEACETFFATLEAQAHVPILATSRLHPSWAAARSRLYAHHFELGSQELAMTDDEAALLIRDPYALRLARGWPAVVGLAASTPLTPPDDEVFDSATLHAYFAEEVFKSIPFDVQRSLFQLSECPDLSLQTATKLLGRQPAERVLDVGTELGFVSVSDAVLVLHPLIRRFLVSQPQPKRPDSTDSPNYLTTFLIEAGCWDEAFDVIRKTKSRESLGHLVEASLSDMLSSGRHDTVRAWTTFARDLNGKTPAALLLAEAELASREGRQVRAEALAGQAARSAQPSLLRARAWNLAGRSAHLRDRYDKAVEYHARAEEVCERTEDLIDALWGQIAAGWHVDPRRAKSLVPRLAAIDPSDLDTQLRVATAFNSGIFQGLDRVEDAADVTSQGLVLVEHATNPLAATSFLNSAARWHALRGTYRESLRIVDWEMGLVEDHRLAFVLPNALNARALALIGLREWAAAARAINAAEAHASDFDDIHNQVDAHTIRLRLLLSQRKFEQALAVADRTWSRTPGAPQHVEFLATRALGLAIAGPSERVQAALADLPPQRTGEIRMLALLAQAVFALRTGVVDDELARVGEHIRSFGCIDPFVVAIRAFPDLLMALVNECAFEPDAVAIVERIQDRHLARRLKIPLSSDTGVRLSKREVEVHELLAQGMTNKEIARVLFIEEVTVKVHVRHILAKLDVRSRVEAATRFSKED
jgi:LuxR family maltose regulon positive regulatory protein